MDLLERLRHQDGVITLAQALECGLSSSAIRRRVADGAWVRVAARVYRAADHPASPRSRVRGVMLSLGPEATLVGATAAWWWRLNDEPPAEVRAAMPPHRRCAARPGCRITRRAIATEDRLDADDLPVTIRTLTVLDAAAELGPLDGARLMDRALQRSSTSLEQLRETHARTLARRGSAAATRLLVLAGGGARSEAERTTVRLLRTAGITGWVVNHPVRTDGFGLAVLDVAFPGRRVAVEIDGWAYHRDVEAFRRDARRQNAIVLDGWIVLRTNWFELTEAPEVFIAAVRRALGA